MSQGSRHLPQISLARRYHDATCYSPEGIDLLPPPDPSRRPPPFKRWHEARRISLGKRRGRKGPALSGSTDTIRLSQTLLHAYGITGVVRLGGETLHLRAAPSAGGLYPTEIYVALRGAEGIPDGIYAYRGLDHCLLLCWEGDFRQDLHRHTFAHPALLEAPQVLIATGLYRRSSWRYGDRAYRRVLLDAGHVLGNLLQTASALHDAVVLVPDFVDAAISHLLLLDPDEEAPLALAALLQAPSAAAFDAPDRRRSEGDAPEVLPEPGGWIPLIHHAGALGPKSPIAVAMAPRKGSASGADIVLPPGPVLDPTEPMAAIRQRRSARAFRPLPLTPGHLGRMLAVAFRQPADSPAGGKAGSHGISGPKQDPHGDVLPEALHGYVVVLRDSDIAPGVYRYHPDLHALGLLRPGRFERALHAAFLGQELGRDCAFAFVQAFDLDEGARRYGDRAYRHAHVQAGIRGAFLETAAVLMGAGASGIGGFFDEAVAEILGLPATFAVAYATVVGIPA